jgi:asparagine synthase (glutamine-hydrolysing)
MCGITGFLSTSATISLTQTHLQQLTNTLRHRGPDAEGYYFEQPTNTSAQKISIGLGHRRLSIIDLSSAANQPFYTTDQRYVLVFNGEIYNYRQLAQQYHLSCRTQSDTEVIVQLFDLLGADFVQQLNGMFTIAIYDTHTQQLHLYRDRLGIKPLYYFFDGSTFVFASELKALLALPYIKEQLSVNHQAITHFLYNGFIPATQSIYNQIHKFPAGHYGITNGQNLNITPFWLPENQLQTTVLSDEKIAKQQLNKLLLSAVEYRLISDVPVGTFLSGGIDSSLVTAIAQKLHPKPIQTFSIGFKENHFNEAPHAQAVANHLGTHHHQFMLSHNDAIEQFDQLMSIYDEPFADTSAIPTLLVSQMARKHVTVALAGDGGDELFCGYGMYQWARRLANPILKLLHQPIAQTLDLLGNNRYQRAAKVLNYTNPNRIKSHILSQEAYFFSEEELNKLLIVRQNIGINEHFTNLARPLLPIEEQALFDLKHYLCDDLLVKVDRASMFHALEVRVPLLDYRVVAFALNLDISLKYRHQTSKYLLKQVLYDYFPPTLFDRPKQGFAIPLADWLKTDLHYLINQYLCADVVQSVGLVHWDVVKQLKHDFEHGKDYLYNRIWALIVLHKWMLLNKK